MSIELCLLTPKALIIPCKPLVICLIQILLRTNRNFGTLSKRKYVNSICITVCILAFESSAIRSLHENETEQNSSLLAYTGETLSSCGFIIHHM
jgi:hypothetical protein